MGWFVDGGCCLNWDLGDFRVPDNRKALDELWELSIIVPLAAFSPRAILRLSKHLRPFGYSQGDSEGAGGRRAFEDTGREGLAELLHGETHPRLHGAERGAERLGDLGVGQAAEVGENDDLRVHPVEL